MYLWYKIDEGFKAYSFRQNKCIKSKQIAKEIRTITIDTDTLPSWDEAKKLLENARVLTF